MGMSPGWETEARTSYDRVAADYARAARHGARREPRMADAFAELARRASRVGPQPVLDLGCGPGWLTQALTGRGSRVIGLDISEAMIRRARANSVGSFVVGSVLRLPLRTECLAGAVGWFVLHHVPDDDLELALDELARVLVAGGVVLIGGHVGDGRRVKTEGYGGHAMNVQVNLRPATWWVGRLLDHGFVIESSTVHDGDAPPWQVLFARKPDGNEPAT